MKNYLILTALYKHGRLNYAEMSAITGLEYSDIAFRGIEVMMGGLIDFEPEACEWFYVGWS
jgi:hypothetical protein